MFVTYLLIYEQNETFNLKGKNNAAFPISHKIVTLDRVRKAKVNVRMNTSPVKQYKLWRLTSHAAQCERIISKHYF